MLVAVPVVADGGAVHGPFQCRRVDARRAERGRFQVGEGAPAVAAGQPDEVLKRLIFQGHLTAQPALVRKGTLDEDPDVVVFQRLQGEQQRP